MGDSMIQLAASRARLLSIAVLWASASSVLVLLCFLLYGRIEFQASGMRSLAVDLSFVVASIPLGLAALVAIWKTFRSLLVVLWPGFVGIKLCDKQLRFYYGPFNCRVFETASLDIRYPFEFSVDDMEGHVEAFLPKQQQYETMLPRMTQVGGDVKVDRLIQKLLGRSDEEIAAVMRPMIEQWYSRKSSE